jgi:hypothetical protein
MATTAVRDVRVMIGDQVVMANASLVEKVQLETRGPLVAKERMGLTAPLDLPGAMVTSVQLGDLAPAV